MHAYHLQCDNCKSLVHLNCLPFIDKNDPIYSRRHSNNWYCTVCTGHIFPYNHHDDDEDFIVSLSESWQVAESVPFDNLNMQETLFIPFDINENENSPLHDADPDLQY